MPSALAIGPGGTNLYVAAASSTGAEPQLLQYAIGAGGLLTPLTARRARSRLRDARSRGHSRRPQHLPRRVRTASLRSRGRRAGGAQVSAGAGTARRRRRGREPQPGAGGPLRDPLGAGRRAVSFDASSAADPDGSIRRYDWDFGDGNVLPTAVRASRTSTPAPAPMRPGSWSPTTRVRPRARCSRAAQCSATAPRAPRPCAWWRSAPLRRPARCARRPRTSAEAGPRRDDRRRAGRRTRARSPSPPASFREARDLARDPRGLPGGHHQGTRPAQLREKPPRRRPAGPLLRRSLPGASAPDRPLPHRAPVARGLRALQGSAGAQLAGEAAAPLGQRKGPLPVTRALFVRRRAPRADMARRGRGTTVVRRGRVAVRDFGRGTTTLVEAGERYLAGRVRHRCRSPRRPTRA